MTAFEDFVVQELPNRIVLILKDDIPAPGYDGDPNDPSAPAMIDSAPEGSLYLQDTTKQLWRKKSNAAQTWVDFGETPSADLVNYENTVTETIYVGGTNASDTNPGTEVRPLATIGAAISLAQTLQTADPNGSILIDVAHGDYSTESLVFNSSAFRRIRLASRGHGLDYEHFKVKVDSLTCTANNNNFEYLAFDGFEFASGVTVQGDIDLTTAFSSALSFERCDLKGSYSFTNLIRVLVDRCAMVRSGIDTFVVSNVGTFVSAQTNTAGGTSALIEWDDASNRPSYDGISPINLGFLVIRSGRDQAWGSGLTTSVVNTGNIYVYANSGTYMWSDQITLGSNTVLMAYEGAWIKSTNPATVGANSTINFYGGDIVDFASWTLDPTVTLDFSMHKELTNLFLRLVEVGTPVSIPNLGAVYTKADKGMYFQDGNGVEHQVVFSTDARLSDDRTASGVRTATTVVDVQTAAAPTAGQVLTAVDGVSAIWQTPTSGTVTGVTATSPLSSTGGAAPDISLSGIVPITNGGTNSGLALNNNRIMISAGGAIQESPAITPAMALISDVNGIPTASSLISQTELETLNGITANIQAQINGKEPLLGYTPANITGDSFTGQVNQIELASATPLAGYSSFYSKADKLAYFLDGSGVEHTILIDSATDANAIHDNVSAEVSAITEKVSPISTDVLLIEDSESTYVKKKVQIANLPAGVPAPHALGGAQHTADTLANLNALISDATLIDTGDTRLSDDRTASGVRTATTIVDVQAATAPTAGQVLTAVNGTSATWQTPTSGTVEGVTATTPLASSGGAVPDISLSGIVPVANGGTNNSAPLSNDRIMISSAGKIQEASAIAPAMALISNANGIPISSTLVSQAELERLDGVTSNIQTQLNGKEPTLGYTPADVAGDSFTGQVNLVELGTTTPVAGYASFYSKSDKAAYFLDGNGTEHIILLDTANDTSAIHDNVSSEISAVTEKVAPISTDVLLIEDSESTYAKKKVQIANLPAGVPAPHALGGAQHTSDTLANVNALISDATLIDTNDSRLSDDRTASGLRTATTVVDIQTATAPTAGQVLTAVGGTSATWQTPTNGTVTDVTASSPLSSTGGATPNISLASPLPIANGGTNSSALLLNNRVMVSSAGSILEHATTTTELGYLSGATSNIQTQLNGKEPTIGYTPANVAGDTFTGPVGFDDKITLNSIGVAVGASSTATIAQVADTAAKGMIVTVTVLRDGSTLNKRISRVFVIWDETANTVSYSESVEVEIGTTVQLSISASFSVDNVLVQATDNSGSGSWTVYAHTTLMG